MRSQLAQLLSELGRITDGLGIVLGHWKGFAVESAYPDGYHRHFNDLDLMVDDVDEAWALGAVLQGAGFANGTMLLRRDPRDETWSGGTTFRRDSPATPGLGWRVDLTFRRVPLHWSTALEVDPVALWPHLPGRADLRAPSAQVSQLLQISELLERDRLFVRDLLDFEALRAATGAPQQAVLREAGLDLELRRIGRRAGDLAGLVRGWSRLGAPLRRRPLRVAATHTLRCAGPAAAARAALRDGARMRWLAPICHPLGRRLDPRSLLERGDHITLLPLDRAAAGGVEWRSREVLATPLGSYLATGIPVIDPAQIAALRR